MSLILLDGFWFDLMPFVRMAKFQFFAQFPMDHLPHTVMFSLIVLLC